MVKPMSKLKLAFNSLQTYAMAHGMHDRGSTSGIHKLKQFNNRNDVFTFKVYQIDNDTMIVAQNSTELRFIFLGSNDVRDWFNNFDAEKLAVDDTFYHKGFYDSAKKFESIIDKLTNDNPDKIVAFIGHSRGGALALIASITFAQRSNRKDIVVVTSGQPRISGDKLSYIIKELEIYYLRVLFIRDAVCGLPPVEMGYEHPWHTDVLILPEKWWHRFRVRFIRVHLSYTKVCNTWLYNQCKNQSDQQWDRS